MIKLFQPKRALGLPNPSAFCVKLETYLRMADIAYATAFGEPRNAPKGKVPWIEDDGEIIADSSFVIAHLKEKYGDPLDCRLTARELALGHAVQRMVEDSLYFVSSYTKWVEDDGFKLYAAELFAGMPEEQLKYIPDMVRKRAIEKLNAQGVARHQPAEVYAIGNKDIASFSALLGDNDYLFGRTPTSYDASAFGVIGNLKDGPFQSPVIDTIRSTANVAAYIDRIRSRYYADLQAA